jgi:hypothetical protein
LPGHSEAHAILPAHIEALLAAPGVVAVVRQDGGRALLVVRELERDRLVLDHFSYPESSAHARALLRELDARHVDDLLAALAAPSAPWRPELDPREGTLFEIDRHGLAAVDAVVDLGDALARGGTADVAVTPGAALVDRVAVQVPFGTDGAGLAVRARLSEEGASWLRVAHEHAVFAAAFITLSERDEAGSPPAGEDGGGFWLRGTPWAATLFSAPVGFVDVLRSIEESAPGSVTGAASAFEAKIPAGPLPGDHATAPGLKPLRQRLSLASHVLRGTIAQDGTVVDLRLDPG